MDWFATAKIDVGETKLFVRHAGCDPPLVLLHGFPQTRRMWRRVAPAVAQRFAVVCPALRGDGDNGCPPSDRAHALYTKRSICRISGAPIMRQSSRRSEGLRSTHSCQSLPRSHCRKADGPICIRQGHPQSEADALRPPCNVPNGAPIKAYR